MFEPSSPGLLPEFLPYLVQSDGFFDHALGTSAGSLSPRTKWQELAKYEFALPPLDEQKRVVLAMTAHDLVASRLETLGRRAGELESSLRDSLFAASAESAERSIADLAAIGPQNGVTVAKNDRVGDLGYVGMSVMFGDAVSTTLAPAESVTLDDAIRTKFELDVGDLLFARRSVVLEGAGRCVMVGGLERPAVFESSIIRVRVDSKEIEPSFLLHYLHSSGGRRLLKSIVRKGAVSGIAGSDLKRLSVRVPSLDQQRELLLPLAAIQDLCGAIVKKQARVRDIGGVLREALLRGEPT